MQQHTEGVRVKSKNQRLKTTLIRMLKLVEKVFAMLSA